MTQTTNPGSNLSIFNSTILTSRGCSTDFILNLILKLVDVEVLVVLLVLGVRHSTDNDQAH